MNILHLSAGNLFGGVETMLVTMAKWRSACPEMKPHFAICFRGRLENALQEQGAPTYNLGEVRVRYPWTIFKARRRLAVLLKNHSFDAAVCHASWPYAMFSQVARRHDIPVVYWQHGIIHNKHWTDRWASRTPPSLTISVGKEAAKSLAKIFPSVSPFVLHPPVETPSLKSREQKEELRTRLGVQANQVVILQASRFEPLKGHHVLLDALYQIRELPNWVCWIVGTPQWPSEKILFEQLQQRTHLLALNHRIHFLTDQINVLSALQSADILCQPNTKPESFGIVFIEALYAGIPVVTSDMGGAKEIVTDDCGKLVPPHDVDTLASTLRNLIQNAALRLSLGDNGPKRAQNLCEPSRQIKILFKTLQKLKNQSSRESQQKTCVPRSLSKHYFSP